MSDERGYIDTADDNDLPASITHERDTIIFDDVVEQDYRFLVYRFKGRSGEIVARMYLDDPWTVSVTEPIDWVADDAAVLEYLKRRFNVIRQLGGPDGYRDIWCKKCRQPER
jgi:hypothetical protein